jgi:hypothetical protein
MRTALREQQLLLHRAARQAHECDLAGCVVAGAASRRDSCLPRRRREDPKHGDLDKTTGTPQEADAYCRVSRDLWVANVIYSAT